MHGQRLDPSHTLRGTLGAVLVGVNVDYAAERHRCIPGLVVDFLGMSAQFLCPLLGDVFFKLLVGFHLVSLSAQT
jgi:hypothetical protein